MYSQLVPILHGNSESVICNDNAISTNAITDGFESISCQDSPNFTNGIDSTMKSIDNGRASLLRVQVFLITSLIACLSVGSWNQSFRYRRLSKYELRKIRESNIRTIQNELKLEPEFCKGVSECLSEDSFNELVTTPITLLSERLGFYISLNATQPMAFSNSFEAQAQILVCAEPVITVSRVFSFLSMFPITVLRSISKLFDSKPASDDIYPINHSVRARKQCKEMFKTPVSFEHALVTQNTYRLSSHLKSFGDAFKSTAVYYNNPRLAVCSFPRSFSSFCKGYLHIAFPAESDETEMEQYGDYSCADMERVLTVFQFYAKALEYLTGGLLSTFHSTSCADAVRTKFTSKFDKLSIFFDEGGFLSPCYPFNRFFHWWLNGYFGLLPYILFFIGWCSCLFSTHPVTLVHFPRLSLYTALAMYRVVVLYVGGNALEKMMQSPYDYSDHVVVYLLFLLIVSIEWSVVARTQVSGSPIICLVRIFYAFIAASVLYVSVYTSMYFHTILEVWLGLFVGFFGLFGFTWLLIMLDMPSLSRIGIVKQRRKTNK